MTIARNPYPERAFPDQDPELAVDALKSAGISPDRTFGCWGREVWDNACKAQLRECIGELMERADMLERWSSKYPDFKETAHVLRKLVDEWEKEVGE